MYLSKYSAVRYSRGQGRAVQCSAGQDTVGEREGVVSVCIEVLINV